MTRRAAMWSVVMRALSGFAAASLLAVSALAQDDERRIIDIEDGFFEPSPVAIPEFVTTDPSARRLAQDMTQVITNNLERSALFRPIDSAAFIDEVTDFNAPPRFQDWRIIGAEALITGEVTVTRDGDLSVGFRLWDTFRQQQLTGRVFNTTEANWRRVAHQISDIIYERYTGEAGYFDTRIVYIEEEGDKVNLRTRLTIMDQDGFNRQYLTDGDYLVFLPTFSPTSQQIVYISYREGAPKTYLFDLETGREEALFEIRQGAESYSARFTADGSRVVTTVSVGGNSDIHTYDLRTRVLTRLTRDPAIDVEPSMDPTGRQIVFTSDRTGGGQRHLYVMNADGSNLRRISQGSGRYGTPVWSPRGDLIAFTKQEAGRFSLGVMRPDGTQERILLDSFKIDRPTWSPNGRVLLYTTEFQGETLRREIRSVDLTGANDRSIPSVGPASDPAWSPLLD